MNELKQALQQARDQFAVYADLHRAKGPGHEEKAAKNEQLVAMCDAALAQPEQLAAVTAERDRLRATLAASCDEERSQLWEAGSGGGCLRALDAEREASQLRAEVKRLANANAELAAVTAERDQLREWKQSQMAVEAEWNPQVVAELLGILPGRSIRAGIMPAVKNLIAERDALRERLAASEASDAESIRMYRAARDERGQLHAEVGELQAKYADACAELHAERLRLQAADPMDAVLLDVATERRRQIESEGWTPEHDDQHNTGAMAVAAACYAAWSLPSRPASEVVHTLWPWTGWAHTWFKPKGTRYNLVRAAALLIAEIERIDRAAGLIAPPCAVAQPTTF